MRNQKLDNIKFLLIFFVVFGHLIELQIGESHLFNSIYTLVYSFHIPLFVMLAGFSTVKSNGNVVDRSGITNLFCTFLVFTFLYETAGYLLTGNLSNYIKNLRPHWILWFLVSLICWKLVSPLFLRIRYPITISVIVSILVGFIPQINYSLGLSRTIYFFPFFVIGLTLAKSSAANFKLQGVLSIAPLITLGVIFVTLANFQPISYQWFYGSRPYNFFDVEYLIAPIIRLSAYCVSLALCVSILLLIPNTKYKFTYIGQRTLYVFLWHGFLVILFSHIGLNQFIRDYSYVTQLAFITGLSFAITFILSTTAVAESTNKYLIYPVNVFLRRKISLRSSL